MTTSLKPGRRRLRYLAYGPVSDAPYADKHKIAELIQRGRAVDDERLVQQALLYARFRARVCGWLGLIFLVIGAGNLAGLLLSGTVFDHVLHIAAAVAFALTGGGWLLQANLCRRGAHATVQASRGR